ncbi:ImmA/IrrE family metallo-endopeptidase [Leuconostocaceae bacterium ESL0958]|nr:ImmA/IrrE family metallo-endopeptidase [Leuconostocaceae bacterium ESL0958]
MSINYYDAIIVEELEGIAYRNGIKVLRAHDLKPSVPDTTWASLRAVIMNKNADTKVSYAFRLAHELSHLMYGDTTAQNVYQFSELCKRGEELLAHQNAIEMLMDIRMPKDVYSFMEYYAVPSWLEYHAANTFNKLNY